MKHDRLRNHSYIHKNDDIGLLFKVIAENSTIFHVESIFCESALLYFAVTNFCDFKRLVFLAGYLSL